MLRFPTKVRFEPGEDPFILDQNAKKGAWGSNSTDPAVPAKGDEPREPTHERQEDYFIRNPEDCFRFGSTAHKR